MGSEGARRAQEGAQHEGAWLLPPQVFLRALHACAWHLQEVNRDSTSFERSRAEWSKAAVSIRGKVGAQGDASSNNWLG